MNYGTDTALTCEKRLLQVGAVSFKSVEDRSGTLNARSCSRSAPTPCSRGPLALSGLRPTRALSGMRVRSYTAVVHVIGNLWNFADPAIDRLGCDWHFSARDHRLIATKLGDHLAGLGITW